MLKFRGGRNSRAGKSPFRSGHVKSVNMCIRKQQFNVNKAICDKITHLFIVFCLLLNICYVTLLNYYVYIYCDEL